jgi:hypothetical protein
MTARISQQRLASYLWGVGLSRRQDYNYPYKNDNNMI